MRVTVLGAGAVGGWLAAGLARGGRAEVSVLARGATLAALRRDGLFFLEGERREAFALPAADDPAALPPADILLLGLKSHDLPAALPLITRAMGPGTLVATAQNGIPWWFFQSGFGGPAAGLTLQAVDPGGALAAAIPAGRVLGGVAHVGSRVEAPGVVRLVTQDRMLFGDPGGGAHAGALRALVGALAAGGVNAQAAGDIRMEIWLKLWGNSNMNPLSALCRADMRAMLEEEGVRGLVVAMMEEMAALGARIGLPVAQSIEERLVVTRRLGAFRTSMLQDLEAGRPMEVGPIIGALAELAAHLGMRVPVLAGVHGLVSLLARNTTGRAGG
jgi:2-dehydropantoate 2-reductase